MIRHYLYLAQSDLYLSKKSCQKNVFIQITFSGSPALFYSIPNLCRTYLEQISKIRDCLLPGHPITGYYLFNRFCLHLIDIFLPPALLILLF